MWISKGEYKNLKENIKCLDGRYISERTKNNELMDYLNERCLEISRLKDKIKTLEDYIQESENYKQKYADEVQKRLELVKLLENTT